MSRGWDKPRDIDSGGAKLSPPGLKLYEMTLCSVVHNLLPMRLTADPRSEMVSQAVFGETVTVLETQGDYALVRTADEYEGWTLTNHFAPTREAQTLQVRTVTDAFAQVLSASTNERLTRLSMGSRVRVVAIEDSDFTRIELPENGSQTAGAGILSTAALEWQLTGNRAHWAIIHHCAEELLGTPYLWGGTSAFGIDCSGLVQRIFGMAGILLPRDAYQQAASPLGERTSDTETPDAMDLVFFCGREDPRRRGITHVGVARDEDTFFHASSRSGVAVASFHDPHIKEEYRYMGGLRLPDLLRW
jgi:cell wall-associated NlpC family hydrolase